MRECASAHVPFVARGAGTGLSGGAVPSADGRADRAGEDAQRCSKSTWPTSAPCSSRGWRTSRSPGRPPCTGYYYAPDPSSQQVCSIGGNVAENSGGAHCLKYGFTTNHVTGLELVTPDGELVELGRQGRRPARLRPDRRLRRLRGHARASPPRSRSVCCVLRNACRPCSPPSHDIDAAGAAVSSIIAAGLVPAALEMMDALAIAAAEAAVNCNYPPGAGAVLIVELDGPAADVGGRARRSGAPLHGPRAPSRSAVRPTTRSGRGSGWAGSRRSPPSGGSARTTSSRTASCPAPLSRRCCGPSPSCRPRVRAPGGERVPRRGRQPPSVGAVRRPHRR